LSRPHPPIVIGGSGERKTLRLVARYADACNLFPGPDMPHKLDVLRRYCDEEQRDYASIEKTSIFTFDGDVSGAITNLRTLANLGIQSVYLGVHDVYTLTPLEAIADQIMPAVADL
jgi:hypothetical protein